MALKTDTLFGLEDKCDGCTASPTPQTDIARALQRRLAASAAANECLRAALELHALEHTCGNVGAASHLVVVWERKARVALSAHPAKEAAQTAKRMMEGDAP